MYDHNKKAGNQGDVVKHNALLAAADVMINNLNGEYFDYADTFTGYAFNKCQPGGEWQNGIGKLRQSGRRFDNVNVTFWRDLWACDEHELPVYPGSSTFIFKLCKSKTRNFRARLWDTSSKVIEDLKKTYDNPQVVEIYDRAAIPEDFKDRTPDLLLIDPPGLRTKSKKQYPDLAQLLCFFDKVPNAILWFPMTAQGKGSPAPETEPSLKAKRECLSHGLSVASVRWSNGIRTCGCRLAYRLPNAAAHALQSTVYDVAALMGWDSKC